MIRQLVRQDPGLRVARIGTAIGAGIGLFLLATVQIWPEQPGSLALIHHSPEIPVFFSMLWCIAFALQVPAFFWLRSSSLALALPLTPRRLWSARAFCLLAATIGPFLAVSVPLLFKGAGAGLRGDPDFGTLRLASLAAAALALAIMTLQVPSPRLHRHNGSLADIAFVIPVGLAGLAYALFVPPTWVGILVPAVLAAALFALTRSRLPKTLDLAPASPLDVRAGGATRPASAPPRTGEEPHPRSRPLFIHGAVFRILMAGWQWLFLVLLVFYGAIVHGYYHHGRNPVLYAGFIGFMFLGILATGIRNAHRIDHLPIGRRMLFAQLVLPGVLVFLIGVGIYEVYYRATGSRSAQISFDGGQLHIPHEFHAFTRVDRAPTLEAPWGETRELGATPLVRGFPAALYNPFHVGKEASAAFVNLQIARAMERIHGIPVPPSAFEPDEATLAEIQAGIDRCCFTVKGSLGLASLPRSRFFTTSLMIFAPLLGIVLSLVMIQFRSRRLHPLLRILPAVSVVAYFAILGGFLILDALGRSEIWAVGAVPLVGIRMLGEAIPLGLPELGVLTALVLVATYFLLERQFRRIEAPTRKRGGEEF